MTRPSRSRTAAYARAERVRKMHCPDAHQRDHRARGEREAPVEDEEDDRGADERQRALHERRHAVGDELVDRLDVVRQPADDHAGAVSLVEAEREPLQVREEPDAKVGEDPLADPAREVRLDVGHDAVGETDHDEDRDDDVDAGSTAVLDRVVERDTSRGRAARARSQSR